LKAVRTNKANSRRQAGAMHREDEGFPYSIEPSSREALGDATQTLLSWEPLRLRLGQVQRGNLPPYVGRARVTRCRGGVLTWQGRGC
jgi:hypothetical protein